MAEIKKHPASHTISAMLDIEKGEIWRTGKICDLVLLGVALTLNR